MVNSRRAITNSILLGLALLVVGCGKGTSVKRFPVYGAVTLVSGEKLNGSITFLPASGRKGPAATTALVDGNYRFDRNNGPAAGLQTVIVSEARTARSLPTKRVVEKTRREWTLSIDVTDDGQYSHDFTLED